MSVSAVVAHVVCSKADVIAGIFDRDVLDQQLVHVHAVASLDHLRRIQHPVEFSVKLDRVILVNSGTTADLLQPLKPTDSKLGTFGFNTRFVDISFPLNQSGAINVILYNYNISHAAVL